MIRQTGLTENKAPSKKKLVHDYIISSVVDGTYAPGTILSENYLVELLAVSKSPVREALIELCNEGILRNIPRLGYEVIRLSAEDVLDIRNLRLALECGFLRLFGNQISQDKIHELYRILDRENTAGYPVSVLQDWEDNSDFHLTLFSEYRNPYAYEILKNALNKQSRAFAQFYWDKWRKTELTVSLGSHREIVEALEKKDLDLAIACLTKDIME